MNAPRWYNKDWFRNVVNTPKLAHTSLRLISGHKTFPSQITQKNRSVIELPVHFMVCISCQYDIIQSQSIDHSHVLLNTVWMRMFGTPSGGLWDVMVGPQSRLSQIDMKCSYINHYVINENYIQEIFYINKNKIHIHM